MASPQELHKAIGQFLGGLEDDEQARLAEVAVPRELFRKILSLIDDLRRRPAPA